MPPRAADDSAVLDLRAPRAPTETRIRAAAISLFAGRGYAATGIRDIAKAAGVTTASLYHYVANKEELLVDIMRASQAALNDAADRSMADLDRPEDRLAVLVSGLVALHATNPMSARVADIEIRSLTPGSPARAEIVGLRDRYEAMWRDVLLAGREDGVFELDDERLTRLALLAMCTGMSEWYRPKGKANLLRICEHFMGVALTAVHARRGRRRVRASDVPMIDLALVPRLPWEPRDEANLASVTA